MLAELAELRTKLGPRHPQIIAAQRRLQEVRTRLDRQVARVLTELETNVRIARAQEQALTRQLEALQVQSDTAARAAIQLRQLTNEADAARSLFDALLQGLSRTAVAVDVNDPDARILSRATPPLSPSSPPRTILLLLTVVAAVLRAVLLVVVRELRDHVYRDPTDLERADGVLAFRCSGSFR